MQVMLTDIDGNFYQGRFRLLGKKEARPIPSLIQNADTKTERKSSLSGLTVFWLAGLLFAGGRSAAQDAGPSEYEVKAAFIVNFVRYVEWPTTAFADAKSPLVIGVLGENPFGNHLEQAALGRPIDNHNIVVKACRSLEEAKQCHALFISNSEKKRFAEVLAGLAGASVLTMGDTDGFTKNGGIINFFREGKKFRFEINVEAAKKARLKISSKLLSLASRPGD